LNHSTSPFSYKRACAILLTTGILRLAAETHFTQYDGHSEESHVAEVKGGYSFGKYHDSNYNIGSGQQKQQGKAHTVKGQGIKREGG
jgi:hypothetical protein